MNIAILHPQCRVRWWAIKMALLTAQSLTKQWHRVRFYTFEHDPQCFPELQEGLTIVTVETTKHTLDTVDKPLSFRKTLQKISPRFFSSVWIAWDIRQVDIVIAHNPPMQIVGALAKIFSFFSRYHQLLNVIWWHHHVPWYYQPKYKEQNTKNKITALFSLKTWKSYFERHIVLPRIKYLVATSYYTAFCIEKYCGRKATVIHPVVEIEPEWEIEKGSSDKIIKNKEEIIKQEVVGSDNHQPSTINHQPPVVLFTHGRLEPGKGLDTLVRVWKEVQAQKIQSTKDKIQSEGIVPVIPAKDEVREVESRWKETIPLKTTKWDDLDSVSEHGMTNIRLIIAWDGSLKSWLIEQWAKVVPYYEGLLEEIQNGEAKAKEQAKEGSGSNSPLEWGGGTIGMNSGVSITDGGTPPNPLINEGESGMSDILAIYLSTIDAFGMAPLEAQIAGLPTIILDKWGARETVLLDSFGQPTAQLVDSESEISPAITYFIQQRQLHKRVSNVNFCHQREYFSPSRLDADIQSLIDLLR